MTDEFRDAVNTAAQADRDIPGSEAEASTDTNTADSSDADGSADTSSQMLNAVMAALKPAEEEAAPGDQESQAEGEKPEADTEKEADKEDDEEDEAAAAEDEKRAAHDPRFGKLLKQRAKFKERAITAEQRIAEYERQYKEPAERFQQYTAKVREMGLDGKDVNFGFAVAHALKHGDLDKAAELLQPAFEQIATYRGEKLPEDLQKKVEDGVLDEASAKEFARLRVQHANAQRQREVESQTFEQREHERAVKEFETKTAEALTQWEERWKRTDPDYQRKQPLVMKECELLMMKAAQSGQAIKSVDDVLRVVEQAKASVETTLKSLLPSQSKREVRTVTGGGSAGKTNPRPQSFEEAIKLAARGEYNPS